MSFNTCSSCEEQLHFLLRSVVIHRFNTCSSCEEQLSSPIRSSCNWGFNTCSSCEEQQVRVCHVQNRRFLFQYMLLLRGATVTRLPKPSSVLFQYMLLLRGATRRGRLCRRRYHQVSIHAPLARSNLLFSRAVPQKQVSIHAPLARSNLISFAISPTRIVSIHAPLARSNPESLFL